MKKITLLILLFNLTYAQKDNRKLVWEENFNGKTLDSTVWNYELGNGCPNICGWGNNESQIYTKNNHKVEDGMLTITAAYDGTQYTSTRITTKDKKEFQYGKMEVRAKLPQGKGLWPAFWMLGSNISQVGWPKSGEIDILEYIGKEPGQVFTSLHTQDSHGNTINTKKTKIEGIEEGFHLYAIDWNKDQIAFYVDNHLVYTFKPEVKNENTWPYNQPFYFLINMAIGGNFGGPDIDNSVFPQEFSIDYIKVYQ
ncbi:MAG: laminarinase [Flavobacterium sp.]|uniref:glycoside hydrolase family 16 protein n=1 Tax=unclassified Flavobacterium TaxID=196869 RepID=UPI000C40B00F|nr:MULTISPECIES: glycoside hydrolase family 16 protein [unclassified Flavobacterium]MBF04932.1 laminarinase [Flavobacterium sp.]MCO6163794.1 glycoside hydrolase family 16 protein [Flavobacterium sp. NRK F7]